MYQKSLHVIHILTSWKDYTRKFMEHGGRSRTA